MTAKKPREHVGEAKADVAKNVVAEVMSFEDYVAKHNVRRGLLVSFKYEASKSAVGLKSRTEDEWSRAFTAQENKNY